MVGVYNQTKRVDALISGGSGGSFDEGSEGEAMNI